MIAYLIFTVVTLVLMGAYTICANRADHMEYELADELFLISAVIWGCSGFVVFS